jgi:hypothetical protein
VNSWTLPSMVRRLLWTAWPAGDDDIPLTHPVCHPGVAAGDILEQRRVLTQGTGALLVHGCQDKAGPLVLCGRQQLAAAMASM